jgi:menaquinone-dependent protoporphyrinogen oxidase
MKTLIAYCSRYGTARTCASHLAQALGSAAEVVDLAVARPASLSPYDAVVIGGSIYAGRIQTRITAFCDLHREELLNTTVGVYLCCLYQGERAERQMREAFPDWLLAHASHAALPGGELRYAGLRWYHKLAIRGLAFPGEDVLLLKTGELDALAVSVTAVRR